MLDGIKQVEFLVGEIRRRRWTVAQKLAMIEESFPEGESVLSVARRHGVAPNLLYRWQRLLQDGGEVAVGCDNDVVGSQDVRRRKEQVRELARLLGRKMLENEILKEAVERSLSKNRSCGRTDCRKGFPDECGCQDIGCLTFQPA